MKKTQAPAKTHGKSAGKAAVIRVKSSIYPLDVVLSAAYIFTDKNYVMVDGDPQKEIIVEITPKDSKADIRTVEKEFNNELINYANYAVRAIQNQKLRESIIHRVLMTNSVEPMQGMVEAVHGTPDEMPDEEIEPWKTDDKDESWFDDPDGIAIPWEEKHGKEKKGK